MTLPPLVFDELIDASGYSSVSRAKIPGGWLILTNELSITFVPDPGHVWNGGSLP